jgi:hypothetical protein
MSKAMTQTRKIEKFEAAWSRYVAALQRRADEIESSPRKAQLTLTMGRRVVRLATRNLRRVCSEIGESVPECVGQPSKQIVKVNTAKLGKVQRAILNHIANSGGDGAYIGRSARAPEGLEGYNLKELERPLAALVRKGIIRREGIRYVLVT